MLYRDKNIESSMKLGFFGKAKGFLSKPTKTYEAVEEDTLGDAIKYTAIGSVIASVLTGLINIVIFRETVSIFGWTTNPGFLLIPISVILTGIFAILGLLILGAWQHLCVLICGGRKGYTPTVKAIAYGSTPGYVFMWNIGLIPYVGTLIIAIATFIVTIIGLRELHQISTTRAIIAWFIAIGLPILLLIVLVIAAVIIDNL